MHDDLNDDLVDPFAPDESPEPNDAEVALVLGVSIAVARLMVIDALAPHSGFVEQSVKRGVITIIQAPDAEWGTEVATAWEMMCNSLPPHEEAQGSYGIGSTNEAVLKAARKRLAKAGKRHSREPVQILAFDGKTRQISQSRSEEFFQAMRDGRPIHAISHEPATFLPADLLTTADQRLVVRPPTPSMITEIARQVCIDQPDDVEPIDEGVLKQIKPFDLFLCRPTGQTVDVYLRRIEALVRSRHQKATGGLDTLPGMGAATEMGMRFAADIQAFVRGELPASELDRGAVLEGPPGCGKTSFAKALAATAGVPFLSGSLQDWQGAKDGHLGTLLAAMRATFDEARRQAPCILLVDEIDSFGDRASFKSNYKDYSRQVVNGFLEQLDGVTSRTGVFVIGCTNDASGIDPAILRPGRLEQVIRIPLPEPTALVAIFRRYLGITLPDANLTPLAEVAYQRQATGADVERWCRVARGTARVARRPLSLDDLVEQVGEAPAPPAPAVLWRAAIHEAGHALGCLACGPDVLQGVRLGREGSQIGGTKSNITVDAQIMTMRSLRRRLRALLAGRAAEVELLGGASSGAGGSEYSDLAKATFLATQAVASLGLDSHDRALLWHRVENTADVEALLATHPEIRERVADMLTAFQADALRMVRRMRGPIFTIAAALIEHEHLDAADIKRIVRKGWAVKHPIVTGAHHEG